MGAHDATRELQVQQLVESVDSIVRKLHETQELLVAGKKLERDQASKRSMRQDTLLRLQC